MKKVTFNEDGTTLAIDEFGNQIPEIQIAWFRLALLFLKERGFDPNDFEFELKALGPRRFHYVETDEDMTWESDPIIRPTKTLSAPPGKPQVGMHVNERDNSQSPR